MLTLYQVILLASITPFAASAVDVTIPLCAPSSAPSVAPDLVSLSIEQDRWVDWAGTTGKNQFFYNALDNLVQITRSPPFIRIGADSEDHTDFSYSVEVYLQSSIRRSHSTDPAFQFEEDIFPAPTPVTPYPEATNITVGQGFYDIISHLPEGKFQLVCAAVGFSWFLFNRNTCPLGSQPEAI